MSSFKRFNFQGMVLIAEAMRSTFTRFPLVLFMSLSAFALSVFLAFSDVHRYPGIYASLLLCAILAIPLSLTVTLVIEARNRSIFVKVATIIGSLAMLALTYKWSLHSSEALFTRVFVQLLVVAHLLVALAGVNSKTEIGFWSYNQKVLGRCLLTGLYSAVLYAGVSFCILTVNELLMHGSVESSVYKYLFFFVLFVFNTWFFLAGFPKGSDSENFDHPRSVRLFAAYLLIPLVLVYLLILYLYMAKILIQGHWPEGTVGYMISGLSFVGIIAYLIVEPATKRKEFPWLKFYGEVFFATLIPLSVMLLLAAYKRIDAYGLTEPRYFLLILGMWVCGIAIYFTLPSLRRLRVIPQSLALLCILTMIGPLSARTMSERSQISILKRQIEHADATRVGNITSKESISEIVETLQYLNEYYRSKDVEELFPKVSVRDENGDRRAAVDITCDQMKTLRMPCKYEERYRSFESDESAFDISGYKFASKFYLGPDTRKRIFPINDASYTLELDSNKNIVILSYNDSRVEFDLSPIVPLILKDDVIQGKRGPFYLRNAGFALVVKHLSVKSTSSEKELTAAQVQGYLLVK